MAEIIMGNPAIAGGTVMDTYGVTAVDKYTPANGTGTITTVEVWAYGAATAAIVATFSADGDDLTARDYELIGAVAQDYNSFGVTLDVVEGDYIGIYFNDSRIAETSAIGDTGMWYLAGDQTQCSGVTFSKLDHNFLSIKGTGTTISTHNYFGYNSS